MKKNGEYVGIDEKFIPEEEKYVEESLLEDKEKTKEALKKFGKIQLGIMLIPIIIFVIGIMFAIFMVKNNDGNITKGNKYTFSHLQGTQSGFDLRGYLDDIITNNKLDEYTTITVIYNGQSATKEEEILLIKDEIPNTSTEAYEVSVDYEDSKGNAVNKITIKDKVVEQSASSFNFDIKGIEGEKTGADWRLDYVITSNKNNTKHIIEVIYKEQSYTTEDEIITLKTILDDWTKYQYSLDYDEKGYINKITIKDIK